MDFLRLIGMPLIIRRMMPVATAFPVLPVRSEILFALLLAIYLATELVAPFVVRLACAALVVTLRIVVAVSRTPLRADEDVSDSFPLLASLSPRAPPVS
jgi:hypothetical protein